MEDNNDRWAHLVYNKHMVYGDIKLMSNRYNLGNMSLT